MKIRVFLATVAVAASGFVRLPASTALMPIDEVKPGMVGVGKTVFEGVELKEFKVQILGVLKNVAAPQRNLILARLEGGPLAAAQRVHVVEVSGHWWHVRTLDASVEGWVSSHFLHAVEQRAS